MALLCLMSAAIKQQRVRSARAHRGRRCVSVGDRPWFEANARVPLRAHRIADGESISLQAFFDFGDWQLIGSSPEVMVQAEPAADGIHASVRPIAGTRPRGQTPLEDRQLEADLLADPKERAEHVMLVDLGRNDLGRVCQPGSVTVDRWHRALLPRCTSSSGGTVCC